MFVCPMHTDAMHVHKATFQFFYGHNTHCNKEAQQWPSKGEEEEECRLTNSVFWRETLNINIDLFVYKTPQGTFKLI